jgi:hypothetical protein
MINNRISRHNAPDSWDTGVSWSEKCGICLSRDAIQNLIFVQSIVKNCHCMILYHATCLEQWFECKQCKLCPVCRRSDPNPALLPGLIADQSMAQDRMAQDRMAQDIMPPDHCYADVMVNMFALMLEKIVLNIFELGICAHKWKFGPIVQFFCIIILVLLNIISVLLIFAPYFIFKFFQSRSRQSWVARLQANNLHDPDDPNNLHDPDDLDDPDDPEY